MDDNKVHVLYDRKLRHVLGIYDIEADAKNRLKELVIKDYQTLINIYEQEMVSVMFINTIDSKGATMEERWEAEGKEYSRCKELALAIQNTQMKIDLIKRNKMYPHSFEIDKWSIIRYVVKTCPRNSGGDYGYVINM
jgi:hypothetical protein